MKYLFAAIDARQARSRGQNGSHANGRSHRHKFDPQQLKRLVVEASEAVDDKSAANDFQETLERIVNEIKNTTEHSGPFLQKVRKADVPDYFDVIKHPMDLATLLKKVKQQSYRTKKAFADDLDLIWSNCLLYNSHPSHPLRHSAEVLRAKSNQLLEFITDPAVTQRTLLVASLSSAALDSRRDSSTRNGTPDEDADGESDDDARSKRALSHRLLNHVNGEATRDSSASPAPAHTGVAGVTRRLSRKEGTLPPVSPSPEPTPPTPSELPFEETPAFVRTSTGMQEFLLLEQELTKLEGLNFNPTKASSILPPSVYDSPNGSTSNGVSRPKTCDRVAELIRHLNPYILPETPQFTPSSTTPFAADTPTESPAPNSRVRRDPAEPLEALWWDIVGPSTSSSLLFGAPDAVSVQTNGNNGLSLDGSHPDKHVSRAILPPVAPALAAAMPHVPWLGYSATPYETSAGLSLRSPRKARSKEFAADSPSRNGVKKPRRLPKKKALRADSTAEDSIAARMRRNCETLRNIRRVGGTLARESTLAELDSPPLSSDESDGEGRPRKRRREASTSFLSSSLSKQALRVPATSATAAQDALRTISSGMLAHAGFEGTSPAALDVLGQLTGQYISNLGRTLRFYSDRYSGSLDNSQILCRSLAENGVPSPDHLRAYVADDVDRYGSRLSDLLARLERTRSERLEALADTTDAADQAKAEETLFAQDGEAFKTGEFATRIGEDFLALADQGLDLELNATTLALPKWMLRGDPRPLDSEATSSLAYSPPPSFVPLTDDALSDQIGLLRPYWLLRASKPELGLMDDLTAQNSTNIVRPKSAVRHKVPPNGRIPFKGKKRPDDPTVPASIAAQLAGALEPKKKRRKALLEEVVVADSGAE
ncbi:hypothetical protein JCM10908_001558 [Rhodotorula pacifica]|uniref:uncharacterized protein n=1 Tax=Rhodotorula pacifica TaxID=1495444 RepID=UPI00317D080C